MKEKMNKFIIGFLFAVVIMIFVGVIITHKQIIINWDMFIIAALLAAITISILSKFSDGKFVMKVAEKTNFSYLKGELEVNCFAAFDVLKKEKFKLPDFELNENQQKDFILITTNTEHLNIKEAVQFGNQLGYVEAGWSDLNSLKECINKFNFGNLNIIESLHSYNEGQGSMIIYLNKENKFINFFKGGKFDENFALLMVADK